MPSHQTCRPCDGHGTCRVRPGGTRPGRRYRRLIGALESRRSHFRARPIHSAVSSSTPHVHAVGGCATLFGSACAKSTTGSARSRTPHRGGHRDTRYRRPRARPSPVSADRLAAWQGRLDAAELRDGLVGEGCADAEAANASTPRTDRKVQARDMGWKYGRRTRDANTKRPTENRGTLRAATGTASARNVRARTSDISRTPRAAAA